MDKFEIMSILDRAARELKSESSLKNNPFILECMTFRMRGHEEASGTKYIPKSLFEDWKKRDPVTNYESFLLKEKIINTHDIHAIRDVVQKEIESAWKHVELENPINADINYAIHKSQFADYHIKGLHYDESKYLATIPNGDVGGAGEKKDKVYNFTWVTKESWANKLNDVRKLYNR